mmetsp:Transcript_150502/g.483837  ORF Transcript_150502/g.483837 Transcript_150502/m.483837 type:complete len:320 (+) Transcript_150502:170-1129(+)
MYARYAVTQCVSQTTICFVLLIFGFEWWVYHISCRPTLVGAFFLNVTFALAVWSYLQTALTDPGTPRSPEWEAWRISRQEQTVKFAEEDPAAASTTDSLETAAAAAATAAQRRASASRSRHSCWRPGEVTWCPDCQADRPERAHHCSQCGYCVLRMDHHCPWVGTCIGWRNHKHFLLLNWWSFWTSAIWLLTVSRPTALQALNLFTSMNYGAAPPSLLPVAGVLLAATFALITGGMFLFSLSMVCRNVTAIEELFPGENPYNLPGYLDNARQLLGNLNSPRLLLPLDSCRKTPTGVAFPVVPKAKMGASAASEGTYGTC